MYDVIYNEMVGAGVARLRDAPVFLDRSGDIVEEEENFGEAVDLEIIHLDYIIFGDETGCNSLLRRRMGMRLERSMWSGAGKFQGHRVSRPIIGSHFYQLRQWVATLSSASWSCSKVDLPEFRWTGQLASTPKYNLQEELMAK
jgi:hypothetical protein